MIKPEEILADFYSHGSKIYDLLLAHGIQVAEKSIKILDNISNGNALDKNFITEAAILHDIGIVKTFAKAIGCTGSLPYLCHGVEGRKMLDEIGLHKHGLVCERHVGMGLSSSDIVRMRLPLPVRNMLPVSFEEKLICYSDKFFSKGQGRKSGEKSINTVLRNIARYGRKNVTYFCELHKYFTGKEVTLK